MIITSTKRHSRLVKTGITVELKIRQRPLWTTDKFETLTATYFSANSQPVAFLATPPIHSNVGEPRPVLIGLRKITLSLATLYDPN